MSDLIAYVQKNHIEVVNLKDGNATRGNAAFTTTRLLVGQFRAADELLTRLVKAVKSAGLFSSPPRLLIQPLEMIEGGLSEVEERVFLELGAGRRRPSHQSTRGRQTISAGSPRGNQGSRIVASGS